MQGIVLEGGMHSEPTQDCEMLLGVLNTVVWDYAAY